jgi:hypothetical protein
MSVSVARALASASEDPADWHPSSGVIARRYIIVSVILMVLCVAHAIWIGTPRFPYDDPYITARNAQLLISGSQDHNFVGTPALAGSTSIVHTMEVALLMFVFPPLWASIVSQYIGILLYGCAVVALTVSARLNELSAWLLISVSLMIGSPFLAFLNGLETSMAVAGMVFAFALVMRDRPSRGLMILAGVLPFIRPELALFSLFLVVWHAYVRVKAGPEPGLMFRNVLQDIGLVTLGALPFVLLLLWNTGSIVPTSVSAKRFFFAEAHLAPAIRWRWMRFSMIDFYRAIGPVAMGALFLLTEAWGALLLSFVPFFILAFYLQFPGALGHYDHRYMYVLAPFAVVGICRGLRSHMKVARVLALLLLLATAGQQIMGVQRAWNKYVNFCATSQTELAALSNFCTRSLEPHSRLLIHDAGYLAFTTNFQMVDLVGLKTPAAMPLHHEFTYPSGGADRHKAIDLLARQTKPDYLAVSKPWDGIFRITNGLEKDGWRLDPVSLQDEQDPNIRLQYSVYRMSRKDTSDGVTTANGQTHAVAGKGTP